MDPDLMPPEELEARAHIAIGRREPLTAAGRIMHRQWHDGMRNECGEMGCVFLGLILGIEAEMRDLLS